MAKTLKDKDLQRLDRLKNSGDIPKHIAIIMDGNGRWAKSKGLPRVRGHQKGVETVREIVEASAQLGVNYLTLYTFSTENWKRPKDEVSTLMRLIVKSLQNETDELNKNNIKLTTIGDITSLPEIVQKELHQACEKTKNNSRMTLNLALSYSGRWELLEAVKNIIREYENGNINLDDIDEHYFSNFLTTKNLPDPDLMIRSGGEYRISNFLLWQLAYSELYVSNVYWPDFNCRYLEEAIRDFQSRERRFGLVSEQISKKKNRQNAEKLSKHSA